jgi:hypothetical protein
MDNIGAEAWEAQCAIGMLRSDAARGWRPSADEDENKESVPPLL